MVFINVINVTIKTFFYLFQCYEWHKPIIYYICNRYMCVAVQDSLVSRVADPAHRRH